ncbi:MAG: NCS2 family permease [Synergistales bacterium]|nr:NCS2 family permease [Synergistales bacterium]MDY6401246.1 NCS2 family permease [Synergistales bacterium]MDY6404414.1 NCS2 family permease [Synergistales bacterium]MDY6410227.1 NCS2 family permease [Synergistales bacterium]MDY6414380.1 NCS2 family permease [Synergistales bacterium]
MFKIRETGSTVTTEILAGITTFVTMSYIIFVNPDILSRAGMDKNALIAATCFSAALATFLMAFMANYPIALAPGMGLNAFFTFSVVLTMQVNGAPVTWQMALAAVFVDGAIFAVLTLTNIREAIMNGIPKSLKIGISAGIGLFIAFIGLQSAGIVVDNPATLLGLGSIKNNMPMMLALGGLFIMSVLTALNVQGALLIGIVLVTAAAAGLGLVEVPTTFVSEPPSVVPLLFKFDFSLIKTPEFWIIVFTFFFVDFFDTLGTLVGVCNRSGLLDENGNLPRAKGALLADAIGTMAGAAMGTSTVTSYVESSAGVAQGGRTGLTAVTTALLFLAALFFTPLIGMVPGYATAPALIIVGVYMMVSLRDLNYDDWTEFIPSLLGFFMMPLAYSISVGIEFAIVSYVIIKILTGKFKDVSFLMVALAVVFILKEFLA